MSTGTASREDLTGRQSGVLVPPEISTHDVNIWTDAVRSCTRAFPARSRLYFEGDDAGVVLFVTKGWLSLSKSLPDGESQIIDFVLPGDIEAPASADRHSSAFEVLTLSEASVAIFDAARWGTMKREMSGVEALETRLETERQARRAERMLRLGRGSAPMRIAYALLELCARTKLADPESGQNFHFPLTQSHLGDFVGLSSVHVCRTMRRLVRNGVISTADHMDVRIHDVDALSEAAGIDVSHLMDEISTPAPGRS